MLSPKQARLDPIPVREMLRGIRFIVKRSGESLKNNAPLERLPKPAADLANTMIDEFMGLGHIVNTRASAFAKTVIGTEPSTSIMLDDLMEQERAEALFAATVYAATKIALARMKLSGMFVSEAAANKAFVAERNARVPLSGSRLAASLTLRLIDYGVLGRPFSNAGPLGTYDTVIPVAIFSVLLWLQSQRQEDDQEAALLSAVDLSLALAPQIDAACRARNVEGIDLLYSKYVANV